MLLSIALLACGLLLVKRHQENTKLRQYASSLEQKLEHLNRHSEDASQALERINHQPGKKTATDPMTGLPTRQVFEDRLGQLVSYSHRTHTQFAVMIFDVDQFNVINSKLGYDMGDKLLIVIAKRLQAEIRQIDTIAWMGSGKFLFLFPQLEKGETAAHVAQRIQDAIIHSFLIDRQEIYIRASMGISVYPTDGQNYETLVKNAENALRLAKENGGNIYQFYHPNINALAKREVAIKHALSMPDFLEKLSLEYQFYYNHKTRKLELVQSMAQLQLADLQKVSFNEFLNISENTNKILEIAEWQINQSIIQYQQWHQENITPNRLLIPLSLRLTQHPHLIPTIAKLLQEHLISPNQVVFEIYSASSLVGFESIENNLLALSQLGVGLIVSVFGLGHFAIQKITHIPITYLKIDNQLIKNLVANKENKFILHKMLTNAAELNISILAEGVEDESQLTLLNGLGCEVMQGSWLDSVCSKQAVA
jgi:diguanylate cyclase (GGDEF)-like protein